MLRRVLWQKVPWVDSYLEWPKTAIKTISGEEYPKCLILNFRSLYLNLRLFFEQIDKENPN